MESQTLSQIFLYYNLLLKNVFWNNQNTDKLFQPSLQKSEDSTFQKDNIQLLECTRMQYEYHQKSSGDQVYPSIWHNQHSQQTTGLPFYLPCNLLLPNGWCKRFFPLRRDTVHQEWCC